MARRCDFLGKKPSTGNNVSHSNRKTKRRFLPNLFKKTMVDPETGDKFTAKLSAKAIKTVTKNPRKLLTLARMMRAK
jgi:large subunit ribosomal protein L28